MKALVEIIVVISIHAPVKGATPQVHRLTIQPVDFNPRSREGSDQAWRTWTESRSYFNPRSREGSDPSPARTCTGRPAFQSTLP